MVEFEADDALATAAVAAARDARVERVIICTPDKDLAQCVRGTRIVQLNRRTRVTLAASPLINSSGPWAGFRPGVFLVKNSLTYRLFLPTGFQHFIGCKLRP